MAMLYADRVLEALNTVDPSVMAMVVVGFALYVVLIAIKR